VPDLSLFDLRGKAALVTGAAVGIGRACATALSMAGAGIAVVDVDERVGDKTVSTLQQQGVDALFIKCDVTNEEQVQAAINATVSRFGRLDIAVNSAGTVAAGTDLEQSKCDWDRVIDLNLTALWSCARAQARQMARQFPSEGKIINIGSMWGTAAGSNGSYCASKAGVIHLSKALAVQWGGYNINVNCISPSWIMTPLFMKSALAPDEFRRRVREVTPLGHMQRPEDLFGAVVFLASSASNYVTGLNLIVDGGHTLNTWHSPMERNAASRVSAEQEMTHLREDLAAMGIEYPYEAT
jgi:NAD(P)-dependent dehydrogenase (short-subunit alcohol dehydrogenase family)